MNIELPNALIHFDARSELEAVNFRMPLASAQIAAKLTEIIDHAQSDAHMEVVLDWAVALKVRDGLNWVEALEAASIAYFG